MGFISKFKMSNRYFKEQVRKTLRRNRDINFFTFLRLHLITFPTLWFKFIKYTMFS